METGILLDITEGVEASGVDLRAEQIVAIADRVNVACGGHAGDDTTMRVALARALQQETQRLSQQTGQPFTYEHNGKQYIAVVANFGNGLGRLQSLTPDIKLPPNNPVTLYVFALPDAEYSTRLPSPCSTSWLVARPCVPVDQSALCPW